MRKIAAMAIMIVMLIPALFILPVNDATAGNVKAEVGSGEFVDITLYFHNESNMDTKPPATNNSTTQILASERQGDTDPDIETVEFETAPLDKELFINQTQKFRVAFNITVDASLSPSGPYDFVTVNLTVTVLADGTECASGKYEGEKVQGTANESFEIDETNLVLNFEEGWDFKFDDRDEIRVKITPEINREKGYDGNIAYDVYMEYDYEDKLGVLSNVYCAPVEIDLSTYDKNNQPKTEFMPNLAAEDCIIKFRSSKSGEDSIKNAFGDDDITEVNIEITGPNGFYCKPENNITENKTKEELYKWDYSEYSSQFVADISYTATITVETVQLHTFTQTTNFNFSAYGLEAKIDDEETTTKTITVGNQTDYTIIIRNTGSFPEPPDGYTDVSVKVNIEISPQGLHTWNISLADESGVVGSVVTNTSSIGNLTYEITGFKGDREGKELTLTANSLSKIGEVGNNWWCRSDIVVDFTEDDEEPKTLSSWTRLAPPHKIDLTWTETYSDPYYTLIDVSSILYVKVTNMGSLQDTVNLTLDYTNKTIWTIALENETVEDLYPYHDTRGYYREIGLTVTASSDLDEDVVDTTVNITAYSSGFKPENANLTRKYLTLSLSRAFGITIGVEPKGTGEVEVEDSDGEAIYEVSIETSDNTNHTVKLTAVPNNKNITTNFPKSVEGVSKDSPKNVTLTVTCPQGMLAGSYNIMITASIKNVDVPGHNKTENVTVTVNPFHVLTVVWADTDEDEITVTAKPGEYVTKKLTVKNEGNSKIDNINIMAAADVSGILDKVVPSQPSLLPGEETNVTVHLYVPKDAKNGDTFVVKMEASHYSASDEATITIKVKQSDLEILKETLYSMIYFIILLIAVIVVFITVWVKKKKMR